MKREDLVRILNYNRFQQHQVSEELRYNEEGGLDTRYLTSVLKKLEREEQYLMGVENKMNKGGKNNGFRAKRKSQG